MIVPGFWPVNLKTKHLYRMLLCLHLNMNNLDSLDITQEASSIKNCLWNLACSYKTSTLLYKNYLRCQACWQPLWPALHPVTWQAAHAPLFVLQLQILLQIHQCWSQPLTQRRQPKIKPQNISLTDNCTDNNFPLSPCHPNISMHILHTVHHTFP